MYKILQILSLYIYIQQYLRFTYIFFHLYNVKFLVRFYELNMYFYKIITHYLSSQKT